MRKTKKGAIKALAMAGVWAVAISAVNAMFLKDEEDGGNFGPYRLDCAGLQIGQKETVKSLSKDDCVNVYRLLYDYDWLEDEKIVIVDDHYFLDNQKNMIHYLPEEGKLLNMDRKLSITLTIEHKEQLNKLFEQYFG